MNFFLGLLELKIIIISVVLNNIRMLTEKIYKHTKKEYIKKKPRKKIQIK
jgi:hypothetical protein